MNVLLHDVSRESHTVVSTFLLRDVVVDCYFPAQLKNFDGIPLMLVNDGQDLVKMNFQNILQGLYDEDAIAAIMCVAIHCAPDRKNEYGTANVLDYKGRGAKAHLFTQFVFDELLPFIRQKYKVQSFSEKAFAGFSLGGLCAMDIVWNHPHEFTTMAAFSGSFWWRDVDQEEPSFDEDKNRIMHKLVREGQFAPWLKFFFEVGTQDETADRNNNGVIDAIDDVVSLMDELRKKGYTNSQLKYVELKDGKHDVPTWAKAFPMFLMWAWGINKEVM